MWLTDVDTEDVEAHHHAADIVGCLTCCGTRLRFYHEQISAHSSLPRRRLESNRC